MKLLSSVFSFKNRRALFVGMTIVAAAFGFTQGAYAYTNAFFKWDQPPAPATNVFYGWNQESVCDRFISADDWVCTNAQPVTKIRWWGSFIGWAQTNTPAVLPSYWKIHIWTDVPKFSDTPWSHPGYVIHEIITTNVPFMCVGLDYHHDDGNCPAKTASPLDVETCYRWDLDLDPSQYFHQEQFGDSNVFWVSILACYTNDIIEVQYPFGIKTRPYNPSAPDCAVSSSTPPTVNPTLFTPFFGSFPIVCPGPYSPTTTNNWWDLAFELYTGAGQGTDAKWEQLPDLSTNGIDVNATYDPVNPPPYLLADDFLCTNTGPITNIVIWGSWTNDILPLNNGGAPDPSFVVFVLSIHADIPDPDGPGPLYSRPGTLLWIATNPPYSFTHSVEASNIVEGWLTPPTNYVLPGDTVCHRYEFSFPGITDMQPFTQQGTPQTPTVYWLDVQARIIGPQPIPRPKFGWKTSITNWNDDAVWANWVELPPPPPSVWMELRYPPPHPMFPRSLDLAFRINTGSQDNEMIKWSQPPVPYENPTNLFNGWNEPSIYQGGIWEFGPITNIVADDWLCTDSRKISDIHWWGSFLNWQGTNLPPLPPAAFHFAIWKDVPAGVDTNFSHPDTVVWTHIVPLFDPALTGEWVGWDVDPRSDCPAVESCFKFEYDIPEPLWFDQDPGTNIYWLSIAAIYPGGQLGQNPFGWKTRPHVPVPPDDAVRIFDPLAPVLGSPYVSGEPIEFPAGTSWDMAFQLTTCEQLPLTNITITNITVTNIVGNQVINLWWNSQPGYFYQVQQATHLSNIIAWSNVSLVIAAGQYTLTNPPMLTRFYRVALPNLCP